MNIDLRSISKIFISIVLGFFFSLGFEPYSWWWTPLVSLALMIRLAQSSSRKIRLLLWYLFSVGFLGPLLHWTSIYVGSMPWVILVLGQSLFFILLGLTPGKSRFSSLAFASLFVVAEYLRATIPFGGFGWGRLGFSQLDGPLQGWLRIGGVALVGGVVALLAHSLVQMRRNSFFLIASILLIPYGFSLSASADPNLESSTYRVGLVQGGVSQLGLDFNATPEEVFNRHFAETEALLQSSRVDLILWPENASDIDPLTNESISKRIDSVLKTSEASLVIGAVTQSPKGPENVSLHYSAEAGLVSRYQKRDLVPFGEYVPLRSFARKFSSLVDTVRDFQPGQEISTHVVGEMSFSPLICFEVLDDEVVRDAMKASTIGVIQTNNATFGRSPQSAQQYQISRVRAYEYQTEILVAATTGRTALISRDGKTQRQLPDFESGHLVVDVSPDKTSPPPIRSLHLFLLSILFLFILGGFNIRLRRLGRIQR